MHYCSSNYTWGVTDPISPALQIPIYYNNLMLVLENFQGVKLKSVLNERNLYWEELILKGHTCILSLKNETFCQAPKVLKCTSRKDNNFKSVLFPIHPCWVRIQFL